METSVLHYGWVIFFADLLVTVGAHCFGRLAGGYWRLKLIKSRLQMRP